MASLYSDLGERAPPQAQVAFIKLKRIFHDKFVQSREFGEFVELLYERFRIRTFLYSYPEVQCVRSHLEKLVGSANEGI